MHVAAVLPPGGCVTVRSEAACASPTGWHAGPTGWPAGPLATQPGYPSQVLPYANAPGVWSPTTPSPDLPLLPQCSPARMPLLPQCTPASVATSSAMVSSALGTPLPQPGIRVRQNGTRVNPGLGGSVYADAASRKPAWQPPSWAAGATTAMPGHPCYQPAHDYSQRCPLATQPASANCGLSPFSTPPSIGIWPPAPTAPPTAVFGDAAVDAPPFDTVAVQVSPQSMFWQKAGISPISMASKGDFFPYDPAPSERSLEEEPAPEEPPSSPHREGNDKDADVSPTELLQLLHDTETPPATPSCTASYRAWDTPPKATVDCKRGKLEASKSHLAARRPEWMKRNVMENDETCPECRSAKVSPARMESFPPGLELAQSSASAVSLIGTARRRPRRNGFKICETCGSAVRQQMLPRLWCSFYLRMKHPSFDLVPMLIGKGGCNTRRIADLTGTKVRVRGKGSGHKEFPTSREAPTPLMLVVATEAENPHGFKQAVQMSVELLQNIESRYREFCSEVGHVDNSHGFVVGPPFDSGDRTELKAFLGEALPSKAVQNKSYRRVRA